MNNNSPQPSFELPPLPQENAAGSLPLPEQAPARPEQLTNPSAPPSAGHGQQAPAAPLPPMPIPLAASGPSQSLQQSSTSPLVADDSDLIEKEWVLKAKQIVAATRDDPHKQNREMSRFKADYLKKRYNKDIKVEGP